MNQQKLINLGLETGNGIKVQGAVTVDQTTTQTKLDTLHSDNTVTQTKLDTLHSDNTTTQGKIDTVNTNLTSDKAVIVAATFTRPDNATAYTGKDVVGDNTNMSFVIGTTAITILHATLKIAIGTLPSGMSGFKFHIFGSAPTAINDNTAFTIIAADIDKYLGYIQFDVPAPLTDATAYMLFSQAQGLTMPIIASSGTLYGVLTTDTGYTPTNQSVYQVKIRGIKCV